MDPRADWSWLRRLQGRVRAAHVPARDKRARLVGADELFALGCRMLGEAGESDSGTPRQRALRYRDGLVVALLAARPLRRGNLAGLRLGHSLVRRGQEW